MTNFEALLDSMIGEIRMRTNARIYSIQAKQTMSFGWEALSFSTADAFYHSDFLGRGFETAEAAIDYAIKVLAMAHPDGAALPLVQVVHLDANRRHRWESRSIYS